MSIISKARLYMRSLRPASSRPTTPSPVRQAVSSSRPAAPDPTTPLPELRPLSMPATNTLLSELGSIARELDALARDKTIHVSRE